MIAMLEALVKLPQPLQWPAELAVAVTVCLGAAWVAVNSCRRRSAAVRAHLWLLGFAAATIWIGGRLAGATFSVPILPAVLAPQDQLPPHPEPEPETTTPVTPLPPRPAPARLPETEPPLTPQEAPPAPAPTSFSRAPWAQWIAGVWTVVAGIILLRVFAGVSMVGHLLRSARPIAPGSALAREVDEWHAAGHGKLQVMLHPEITSPVSFGVVRGWVLLPEAAVQWEAARVRLVLAHEIAHCQRRDYLAVLLLRIFCAACWFHPFPWLGLRRFRALCENAADDRALEQVEATAYAEELLSIVRELRQSPPLLAAATLSIGEPTTLRERIAAMLDATKDRARLSLRASLITSLVAIGAAILISGVRLVHAENAAPAPGSPAVAVVQPDQSTEPRPAIKDLVVTVRDEKGTAIPGAEIKPGGTCATLPPTRWFDWNPAVPRDSVTTDAAGRAVLRIPAYANKERVTGLVDLSVTHPDYCPIRKQIEVTSTTPLVLQQGGLIEVGADAEPGWFVCADLDSDYSFVEVGWKPKGGNNRVEGRVPPGKYTIRAAAMGPAGKRKFSDVVPLEVREGVNQEIVLPLAASVAVRGRLSSNVPRPVKNGRVLSGIMRGAADVTQLSWLSWAPVQADGTFELTNVPRGHVELIVLCDGYVSRNPFWQHDGNNYGVRPQRFFLSQEDDIEVAMEKTGRGTITVLTPDGKPLRDAKVAIPPYQEFGRRDYELGLPYDTGQTLLQAQHGQEHAPPFESLWTSQTDAQGVATISNLPPGHSYLSVTAPGLEMPDAATIPLVHDGSMPIKRGETTHLTVTMGAEGTAAARDTEPAVAPKAEVDQTSAEAPLAVTPGRDLRGRVVDEKGSSLAGVLVDAWVNDAGNETVTNTDGTFLLKDPAEMEGRRIEVQFSLAGFSPVYITRQSTGTLTKDVVLSKRTYFEGVVLDSLGQPVPGQVIRATAGEKQTDIYSDEYWCETHSDERGRYRLHVYPDNYRLEIRSKSGEVARIAGQAIARGEARELDIRLSPGATFGADRADSLQNKPGGSFTL